MSYCELIATFLLVIFSFAFLSIPYFLLVDHTANISSSLERENGPFKVSPADFPKILQLTRQDSYIHRLSLEIQST